MSWELIKWSPKRKCLIFYQILSTNSLAKCMEISLKNLYGDIGAKIKVQWFVPVCRQYKERESCYCKQHVPSPPARAMCNSSGLVKKEEERFLFPAHRFPDIFYLEPNYYMLAIILRVGAGTPGNSWWGVPPGSPLKFWPSFRSKNVIFRTLL